LRKVKEAVAMVAYNLTHSIEETHRTLEARLDTAAEMVSIPGQPRKGYEHTDTFLAAASRHLNAVEDVLVRAVRKNVEGGGRLAHDYVKISKELEIALANAKAREYGSAYAVKLRWEDVWGDVRIQLREQHACEHAMVERLAQRLDEAALDDMAEALYHAELAAPSRPHPYAPHLGVRGKVSRRVLHAVDAFWDAAEGRMVPEPARPPHKKPGLIGQYLLADPRFDEEE
jgi:hypothetical protein